MDERRANWLIKKIEKPDRRRMCLARALEPLMKSPDFSTNFGRAAMSILEEYKNRVSVSVPVPNKKGEYMGAYWLRYENAVNMFQRYFGLNGNGVESSKDIAKSYGVGRGFINNEIRFLTNVLIARRSDLWIRSL